MLLQTVCTVIQQPATLAALCLSGKAALVVLPLLALWGVILGYVLGRFQGRFISVLDFIITLPLVFPPIASGFILLMLLGRRSIVGGFLHHTLGLDMIFSFWSVVLASFIAGLPLIVKQVQAAIRRDTKKLIESAYVLGKSPCTTFIQVVLPSIRTSIVIGLSLAFARSLGEVGVTLMLGGNISGKTNTISLEVYNAVFTGEYERAYVLVAILGALSLLLISLTRILARCE
ncbi:molybdate ABC transporter permease subunit [Desulfogranum japonicum]|uniref:molybdate ABC transporter permease subunit n=1 Tax=Desulfogranum japonicum TaxID=231447 RepID=UPI000402E34E|nr:ABC transporter permease subunit [Desulfogranum japonicum]